MKIKENVPLILLLLILICLFVENIFREAIFQKQKETIFQQRKLITDYEIEIDLYKILLGDQ